MAIASVAAVLAVRGVPADLAPAALWLPELLALPVALLALRLGRHRPLAATVLLVALHRLAPLDGALAAVAALNLVALALVPELRVTRPAALLHLGVAAASLLAAGWPGGSPWIERIDGSPRPAVTLAAAALAGLVAVARRRGPFEGALPWAAAAVWAAWWLEPGAETLAVMLGAAQAVVLFGLVEEGRRLAFHDRLTGLANRRALDDRLARLRGDYTLAVIDVDRFKGFNDRFGHDAGDQALRMVASELARVGGGGTAYRSGGEEFVVVLPGIAPREAAEHLEAVRSAIAGRGFVLRSPSRPRRRPARPSRADGARKAKVTVSVGIAGPGARHPRPADVLRAADRAMYRAKGAGRDRVVTL